jgi:2Fe-2S ferredoxin
VLPGEAIMKAATRLGYTWPTVCGGQGECKTCVLEVHEGADLLEPMAREEERGLQEAFGALTRRGHALRLACQARPLGGPVVVYKRGVRASS